jgi:hypothetical protein
MLSSGRCLLTTISGADDAKHIAALCLMPKNVTLQNALIRPRKFELKRIVPRFLIAGLRKRVWIFFSPSERRQSQNVHCP